MMKPYSGPAYMSGSNEPPSESKRSKIRVKKSSKPNEEGKSLTNVSRDEKTPVELFYDGVKSLYSLQFLLFLEK